jgi:antitoxin component of RelBE/YafQ-DinJ toxin-antitoxin module
MLLEPVDVRCYSKYCCWSVFALYLLRRRISGSLSLRLTSLIFNRPLHQCLRLGVVAPGREVKTLAIRLDDELHAQLHSVTLLEGVTITDAIRTSIRDYIDDRRISLRGKAQDALVQIDQEASERRAAISSLFGVEVPMESGIVRNASFSKSSSE